MNTKHTPGKWRTFQAADGNIYITSDTNDVAVIETATKQSIANSHLIAAAPELMQMVNDLKNCIGRLCHDRVSQDDRDKEAQWIGEAHELLYSINTDYVKGGDEK